MKKKLNILLLLVLISAVGITAVLVSWLLVSYKQRMELLKGTVENDMFDAFQHVLSEDLQKAEPSFSDKALGRGMPGIVDSISEKYPNISSQTVKVVLSELRNIEEKNLDRLRPEPGFKPDRLIAPPILRNLHIDDQKIEEIREEFDRRLKAKNLSVDYDFQIGTPEPRKFPGFPSDAVFHKDGMQLRPLLIYPEHNKFILVKIKHSWKFFLYAMNWQLIVSLLILGTLLGSFVYLFLTIFRQNKLNLIRKSLMHSMSHELRTPVTTARVALEAMEDFVAPDDHKLRKSYNAMAREDLDHLSIMLDKVLDIANLENKNHTPLERQDLEIHSFLSKLVSHFSLLHAKDEVKINFHCDLDKCYIYGDSHHLKNVFNNLFDNSVKYGATEINVELKEVSSSKIVQIIVRDNGIGIPSEYQEEVFESFFRVPRGNLYEVKGLGLGLSYVKQIINKHMGSIKIKSDEGEGCSFILNFPKE